MFYQTKKLLCILLCVCSLLSLYACGKADETEAKKYDSFESMTGISAGVFVGAIFDDLLLDMIPTASLSYYQSGTECIGALLEGKIDLTINEDGLSIQSVRQNPELTLLPYKVSGYDYGAIFGKNEKGFALCSDFDEFIRQTWSDEALAYLYNTWLADEDGKDIDYQSLPSTNGTITVATDSVYYPLTYIRNGKHTGFEIELIYEYCKARGYALKFDVYDFGGVLAAVSSGKADAGFSSVIITEERMKSYYFSEPYASGSALLIIRKENAPGKYNHIRELDRKTIGIHEGSIYDTAAMASIVEPSIKYMDSETDILMDVEAEKLDAAIVSEAAFKKALAENRKLVSIGSIGDDETGFALVIVKAQDNSSEDRGFFSSLKNKFRRTLIEDNRYKLYINGIITTCIISLASAAAGLVFGYLLFLLFRSNLRITSCLLRIYEWIVNALPAVVILMIFYYIVFGDSRIDGVWVSVIAFTVIFSVAVFGLLKTCFVSVDTGQYEAAYALGYNRRETMYSVIIPQVLPVFLPPFKSEFMNLFKATSVVGYIAVQDITKISDIIRSLTYEAFFPLIVITISYFIITALFSLLINFIEKKFDPKARDIEAILKEVRCDD